ncbi:Rpn family recombination-promoting nuclease/putative transposase [Lentibacillus sediminis]|uniref:Rpn family recombination-promoting nuclease/putative transposase n=1 Tax=Lentibacillus sediminis TaxID=1940529 RepID=UPI001EFDF20A|nr:Rpn family recombination-promoting nuclease/putative transposase [Lentibacillus sediminis]
MTHADLLSQITSENAADTTQVMENRNNYIKRKRPRGENEILKDTPLENLMDLKVDFAFKQLLGSEKNKHITIAFLNAILQETGRERIQDISFKDKDINREYEDDKLSRLDLLVQTEADGWINVEIQFSNKYNMIKRSLYYWSRIYSNPLGKGMGYKDLRPVIAINIVNFDLFSQTERFHTTYHLFEDEEQFKLTDEMEFHYFEMTKVIKHWKEGKLDPWTSPLAKWFLLLAMVDHRTGKVYDEIYKVLEEISVYDDILRETLQNWKELSLEQEQRLAYEARLKQIMDEESFKRENELILQEAAQKRKEADQKTKEADQKTKEADQKRKEADQKRKEAAQDREMAAQERKKAEQLRREDEQLRRENEQRMKTLARQLLEKDMGIDFVADSTGLSKHEVTDILRDLQN